VMTLDDSTQCATCDGNGRMHSNTILQCLTCGGSGRTPSGPVGAVDAQHISRDTLAMLEREWLEELRRDAIAAQFAYAAACVREVAALHTTPPRSPATVTEVQRDAILALAGWAALWQEYGTDDALSTADIAAARTAALTGGRDAE
jgi:hypothetical protein